MTKVSDRLNRLAESATLAMARMSRELQAKGIDVIALSLGEPDFDTPDFIRLVLPTPGGPSRARIVVCDFGLDIHCSTFFDACCSEAQNNETWTISPQLLMR